MKDCKHHEWILISLQRFGILSRILASQFGSQEK